MFEGRKPEEIKFKPGDIVEVFGYPGNDYWSNDCVDLAIVVKCPRNYNNIVQLIADLTYATMRSVLNLVLERMNMRCFHWHVRK